MKAANRRLGNGIALTARMILGAIFIVSAVAKIVGIDSFEIYIFSYNVLPLNCAMLAARLIIVAELLTGLGLTVNVWRRFVNSCTILLLTVFTLFLGYAALMGRTDSCQCMGSLVELNPLQSLLKNAVLALLLVVAMRARPWNWRPKWYVWLPVVVTVCVVPFILSAPDNWLFGPAEELYNAPKLEEAMGEQGVLHELDLDEDRHVVAFLSPGCQFCRMTDEKLTYICRRNDLDSTAVVYLAPTADTTISLPSLDTTAFIHPCYLISNLDFVQITYGQRPMVFLMEDGEVKATCHYRNIDERQITTFLHHEEK